MTFLEMIVNPFQWQRILATNTNGEVMITVVSEIFNKQILLINVHYKISCLHMMINYFPFRPSFCMLSNAYSNCLIE